MIKYHKTKNGRDVAEIQPGAVIISSQEEILEIIAETGENNCSRIIIHKETFHEDFFDLKTRLAGEILQKFSNYRMKLAITGDFTDIKSKSLRDFIRESNRGNRVFFIESVEEALSRLDD